MEDNCDIKKILINHWKPSVQFIVILVDIVEFFSKITQLMEKKRRHSLKIRGGVS